MAEPTADQVIPKVFIKEALPGTPAAGSVEAFAKKMTEAARQANWREGLESLKKETKADKTTECQEQIGVERDPASGKKARSLEEQNRFDKLGSALGLAKNYLEKTYDGLDNSSKVALRATILIEANLRPLLKNVLSSMTNAQKDAFLERILKEPKYVGKVKELLDQALERKLADAVTPAKDEFEKLDLDRQDKQQEVDGVSVRIAEADRILDLFKRDASGAPLPASTNAKELDQLTKDLPKIEAEIEAFRDVVEDRQRKINGLNAERGARLRPGAAGRDLADIDKDIDNAVTEIRVLEKEIKMREDKITRKTVLEQQEGTLTEQKKNLVKEKQEKTIALKKAELEAQIKKRILEDAKNVRTSQEQDLVDSAKNIFADAARELWEAQGKEYEQMFNQNLETFKKETQDQNAKVLADAISERYKGTSKKRRGILVPTINQLKLNTDRQDLLDSGPEKVIRNLLGGKTNPATGAVYTAAEIDTLLKDKAFLEKATPVVGEQLYSRVLLNKDKLSVEEATLVATSDWGKGMIEQAIKRSDEVRNQIEALTGQKAVDKGFWTNLAEYIKKHPWLIAVILGLPLLGGAGLAGSMLAR